MKSTTPEENTKRLALILKHAPAILLAIAMLVVAWKAPDEAVATLSALGAALKALFTKPG